MSEVEYCIWDYHLGQCDTSTDWRKLYDIVMNAMNRGRFRRLYIIPTALVGKGKFMSAGDMKRLLAESEARHREHKKEMKRLYKIHEEQMEEAKRICDDVDKFLGKK